MSIKYFCDDCGKEIFQCLEYKDTTSIAEIERNCLCSDCLIKEFKKLNNWEYHPS